MNYLYRHIRLDKNEPFYIGIANSLKRPFSKDGRNRYWNHIVAKTDYDVEIIYESESDSVIRQKEVEFIKIHGRKDLGMGSLVNMNDGGDGLNRSKESIKKQLDSAKKSGEYDKMVERMRFFKNNKVGADAYKAKKVFAYSLANNHRTDLNGHYIRKFSFE